jgi:RNA polymerase sigma-70 factor (ECF subfamily)
MSAESQSHLDGVTFKRDLVAAIPSLRAFARSLCGDATRADDLVQDTMLKAWQAREAFIPGTNFKAWTYRILRNTFYSSWRKDRRLVALDDDKYSNTAKAVDDAESSLHLAEVAGALLQLPAEQREALILTTAGGFDYEQVAAIAGVAVGTIKSRVSRGRAALTKLLEATSTLDRERISATGGVDALARAAIEIAKRSEPVN